MEELSTTDKMPRDFFGLVVPSLDNLCRVFQKIRHRRWGEQEERPQPGWLPEHPAALKAYQVHCEIVDLTHEADFIKRSGFVCIPQNLVLR